MSSVSSNGRARKPRKSQAPTSCKMLLFIGQSSYWVKPIPTQPGSGVLVLVRLHKDDGQTYWVARHRDGSVTCDCPHAEFRTNGTDQICKHAKSLIACRILPAPTPRDEWEREEGWVWNLGPEADRTADAEMAERQAAWHAEAERFARESLAAAVEAGIADAD